MKKGFYFGCGLLLLAMLIFITPLNSAFFEFDNVKTYDPIKEEITFTNTFLKVYDLDTFAKATLDTPRVNYVIRGKDRKVAEFTIETYTDYDSFIKGMELVDLKTGKPIERNVNYKYKEIYEVTVQDRVEVCVNNTGKDVLFKTTCQDKLLPSFHTEKRERWIPLEKLDLKTGVITIGIFTDVLEGDYVEWYPTLFGVKVTEWATWIDSLSLGLKFYYKMEETSGTIVDAVTASYNSTNSGVGGGADYSAPGKIANGLFFIKTGANTGDCLNISASGFDKVNMSFNYWIKITNLPDGGDYAIVHGGRTPTANKYGNYYQADGDWCFGKFGGTELCSVGGAVAGSWAMMTIIRNDSSAVIFKDGSIIKNGAFTDALDGTVYGIGGCRTDSQGNINATVDEFGWWNRTLSQAEITQLYASGDGMTYTSQSVTSTLLNPINNSNQTTSTIYLNVSCTPVNMNMSRVNIFLYNKTSGTLLQTVTNTTLKQNTNINISSSFTSIFSGNYSWKAECVAHAPADTSNILTANSSVFNFFSNYTATPITITSTLKSPLDNYYSNQDSLYFVGNFTVAYGNFTNTTLIVNSSGKTNYTTLSISDLNQQTSLSLGGFTEGIYQWNYYTCAVNTTSTYCAYATSNYTFTIDTTSPSVDFTRVGGGSVDYLPNNITINITASDTYLQSCKYFTSDNLTNTSVSCNSVNNVGFATPGFKNITVYANDSAGNYNSITKEYLLNFRNISVAYAPSVIEGDYAAIYFNISYTYATTATANINYNGTNYAMTEDLLNTTTALFSKSVIAPAVTANSYINFNISYSIDGNNYNTSNYSQIIYNIPPLNVSVGSLCSPAAILFNFKDERNLTLINATVQYNFKYGKTNNTFIEAFGKLENINNFSICPNFTISPIWYMGYGELFYTSTDYVDRRYYIFDNTSMTNITDYIDLHSLLSADQTSFKLEVEDTSLNPYDNVFTRLIRWYPDLDEYKVVDMGLTDETGSTVIHVKTEDVDYRIGVYERNGTLIKLANPIRMVCLATPCTYTLKISPEETDYTSFLGITYDLDYNYTTGIWTFTYSDDTGRTNTMNLTVWKDTGTNSFIICSSTTTGTVGAVSCDTSTYTGTLRAQVVRSASPGVILIQKVVNTVASTFKSPWGLFLSFLLAIPVMFMLVAVSPIAAIIGGIVALIPALYFGSINWIIFSGFIALGGIIINFIKRT